MKELNLKITPVNLGRKKVFDEIVNLNIYGEDMDYSVIAYRPGTDVDLFITEEYGSTTKEVRGKTLYIIENNEMFLGYASTSGRILIINTLLIEVKDTYGIDEDELKQLIHEQMNTKKLILR